MARFGSSTKREGDPADYFIVPAHGVFDRHGELVLNKVGNLLRVQGES